MNNDREVGARATTLAKRRTSMHRAVGYRVEKSIGDFVAAFLLTAFGGGATVGTKIHACFETSALAECATFGPVVAFFGVGAFNPTVFAFPPTSACAGVRLSSKSRHGMRGAVSLRRQ